MIQLNHFKHVKYYIYFDLIVHFVLFSFRNHSKSSNNFYFTNIKRNSSWFWSTKWMFWSIYIDLWNNFIQTTKNLSEFNYLYRFNTKWTLSNLCGNKTKWMGNRSFKFYRNSTSTHFEYRSRFNEKYILRLFYN